MKTLNVIINKNYYKENNFILINILQLIYKKLLLLKNNFINIDNNIAKIIIYKIMIKLNNINNNIIIRILKK